MDTGEYEVLFVFTYESRDDTWERDLQGARAEIWVPPRGSPHQHWALVTLKKFKPLSETNRRHLIEQLREAYHMQDDTPEDFLPPQTLSGRYAVIFGVFNLVL